MPLVINSFLGKLEALSPFATDAEIDDTVRRDEAFYSDHVVFQVEKRLFKVPRRKFEEESEIFRDMFALPAAPGNDLEGTSDEHPLVLESIEERDFRPFLRVMLRPHYGPTDEEKKEIYLHEWTSVLKLSTLWQFTTLRAVAIENMTPLLKRSGGSAKWISLARTYSVREWLLPALHALARRQLPLQIYEVDLLGIETVLKMAEVRESYLAGSYGGYQNTARASWDFEHEIRRVFEDDLKVSDK